MTPGIAHTVRKSLNMSIDSASPAVLEIGDFEEEDDEILKLKMFSDELKFGRIANYSDIDGSDQDSITRLEQDHGLECPICHHPITSIDCSNLKYCTNCKTSFCLSCGMGADNWIHKCLVVKNICTIFALLCVGPRTPKIFKLLNICQFVLASPIILYIYILNRTIKLLRKYFS